MKWNEILGIQSAVKVCIMLPVTYSVLYVLYVYML